ncbi:COX5A-domain-containing protein [Protomyces lactucae-debilis]|uniref:Cytochrome c oxidase subunit 6, mitochondrial n=1 Tax=Protomyces lactucae-debilis TaxID=2754530 RepID=A0A1Y2EVI6_PROLT|nr:COX5A-domain-containing protein [Protomyces lactucae-debilis]ORY74845.1 COX5A-domain-containing protein [Protomyces lactucae-debilis]
MLRTALRNAAPLAYRTSPLRTAILSKRAYSAHAEEESFESFSQRYEKFFAGVEDLFELQRGLNNCFAYDLVPSPGVIEQALRASRRVNDFATSVRIFEGIKQKVENKGQYAQYLEELKPLREELGISLKEDLIK